MATYKPVTPTDIDVLIGMMQDFYAIDGYPIEAETSKRLLAAFISDANLGRAWLIEQDGIVGYIIVTFVFSFEFGGKIAFVDELYISEDARGKGLGKSSVDFIKSEAETLGLKLLYLEVEHHNSNAKKLYLSKGFSEHKRQLLAWRVEPRVKSQEPRVKSQDSATNH